MIFPQYHCIWSKPQVGPSDKMVHLQLPSLFLEMTQPGYTISQEPPRYWWLLCGRMGASLSPTYLRTNRLETLWGNGDSFLVLPERSSSPVNLCMCCVCLAAMQHLYIILSIIETLWIREPDQARRNNRCASACDAVVFPHTRLYLGRARTHVHDKRWDVEEFGSR